MTQITDSVYYEQNGDPVTGLTPTASVTKVGTNASVSATVTAVAEHDGFYDIVFEGEDNAQYRISTNAGTDSVTKRKQAWTILAVNHVGGGNHGASYKIQAPIKALKSQLQDEMKKLIEVSKGEIQQSIKDIQFPVAEKVEVPDHTKEIESLTGALSTVLERLNEVEKSIDFPSFTTDLVNTVEDRLGIFEADVEGQLEEARASLTSDIAKIDMSRDEFSKALNTQFEGHKSDLTDTVKDLVTVFKDLKQKVEENAINGQNLDTIQTGVVEILAKAQGEIANYVGKVKDINPNK